MNTQTELVLSVETARLRPFLTRRGLLTEHLAELLKIIQKYRVFLPRPEAEGDPLYRQIIPYVAILREGQVFSTRRLKRSGEARLHGLISLGVGGHINPDSDGEGADALMRGLCREIEEEVFVEGLDMGRLSFHGFINDDSNEVGSVHLGLFCTLRVSGEVSVRETDKLSGDWLSLAALRDHTERMETWSALIAEELIALGR